MRFANVLLALVLHTAAAQPVPPAMGWLESSPAEQGINAETLARLREHLQGAPMARVRSVLVVRHDRIVFEYYRSDVPPDALHEINSATKSIVSALVGIALQQGALTSLDQKVADFLPEAQAPGVDPQARDITILHLLTMTSGFAWDEKARDACRGAVTGACARFDDGGDPTAFALRRPFAHAPGSAFNYDSASVNLLAVALARATKMPLPQFAQQTLGSGLGIAQVRWARDPQGNFLGARGMLATSRDLARFGNLFLRNGAFDGKQLVPSAYVAAATRRQLAGGWPWPAWVGYGYLWWCCRPMAMARRATRPTASAASTSGSCRRSTWWS